MCTLKKNHCLLFYVSSVQIDHDVIVLMDDATLENYIPSYGDRIAVFNFCRSKKSLPKRKHGLLERLREKMRVRKEGTKEKTLHEDTRTTDPKKLKSTRNVEIGWIHDDGKGAKQVRTKQGGGTRKTQLPTDAGLKAIVEEGQELFFPGGISPKGPVSDFQFEVWDFKQNRLTDETCQSIGIMYMTAKLSMLRFYIATRPKEVEDDASETSDVVLVSSHSSNETSTAQLQVGDATVDFDVQSALEMSVDAEITFGPLHDIDEDTDDTLIYEGFLIPTSPPNPEDVITIVIHHANTLHDMITAFSDAEILNKAVNVKRILPDNTEEAGSGSGVMRDVLSCFWHEFYERCTLGTAVKVPFIRHDFPAETWKAIGRILLKGYQDCQYLPNKLALPFLEQVLFKCVYSDLNVHFLQFVSREERDIFMQAMSDFSTVDCDDLVEILDSYGCRRRITAKTLPTILDEIAHKELVQKPMFVIDCWREIIHHHLFLSPEALIELLTDLQPTSKKVCQLLKFANDLTPKQKEVRNHLKRFIRELDEIKLQKFLRFCTGSDLVITDSIYVEFEEMSEFSRRPIGHRCGKILHIAASYDNFPDFRSEFNAVLESNVWVMDIV